MADDWVVDSLVGFLRSPLWMSPVQTFLEEECIVFDEVGDNEPVYRHVYSQYKAMVDKLMGNFMSELGVSTQQLTEACSKSKNLKPEHEKLFQPLLASGDYEAFKSVMTQKNIDLELQALALLQKQLGQLNVYDSQTTESPPQQKQAKQESEEEEAMKGALELSKRESELVLAEEKEMDKLMELAIQESLKTYHASQQDKQDESVDDQLVKRDKSVEQDKPVERNKPVEKPVGEAKDTSEDSSTSGIGTTVDSITSLDTVPPLSPPSSAAAGMQREISGEQAAQLWIQSAKSELKDKQSPEVKKHISKGLPEDLKARERYLKSQRDRLLERKKKARTEELKCYQQTAPKNPAPSRLHEEVKGFRGGPGGAGSDSPMQEDGIGQKLVPKGSSGVLCSVIARKLKEEAS